jgi:hypothetical protein
MRAKEFTRETIAPIAPVAPVATRPIDKAIAQTGQTAGPAGIDQAIAATPAKPATPYNQSALGTGIGKIGQGLSSLAKAQNPLGKFGSRFAQGFSAGFKSTLSSAGDDLSKAGTNAAFAADVAAQEKAEAPAKQAFNVFAGIIGPEQVNPQLKTQVDQILKSQVPQQQGWLDHVKKNTTPWDTPKHPLTGTDANAQKRTNPNDIVAYLKQNSRGQKLTATGNLEVDKLLKAQGLV